MGSNLLIVLTIALVLGFVQAGRIHGPGRIQYGTVEDTQFPYMAFLQAITSITNNSEGQLEATAYDCGGTVINEHWILTAAHCTRYPNLTRFNDDATYAYLGSNDAASGESHQSDMMISHPNYMGGAGGWDYDIALIHFPTVLNVDYFVTLGPKDFDTESVKASVIGWGAMEDGNASPVLRKANIQAASASDTCPGGDRKTQICFPIVPNTHEQFGEGDSGGPLLYYMGDDSESDGKRRKKRSFIDGQDPADLIQIALVSNHEIIATDPKQVYNFFTDISQFLDWISETIANNPEP